MVRIRPESSTSRRRLLRGAATDAERRLWQHLRAKQAEGYKFRRQHSVGRFVLDFYCADARLAVEVDGNHHAEEPQRHLDEQRTAYLEARGIRVIRFSDREVLTETESVLAAIWVALS